MTIRAEFRHPQRGFSLVELMVAILVSIILLGGMLQIYQSNKRTYNAQEQLSRLQETGRFSMDIITADLRRSGYWGENADSSVLTGNPGPANPASTCSTADNSWGRMVEWRISGLNDTSVGFENCAADYLAGNDLFTVRHSSWDLINPVPANGGLFLRSTLFTGRVMTGALAADVGNAIPPANPGAVPAHLQPVVRAMSSNAYYVADSGRECNGIAIPVLQRIRLDPATGLPVSEELVSGVERLQVRYLVNVAGVPTYIDADEVGVGDAGDWPTVRGVRVWLLARAECPEIGLDNPATYQMGDLAYTPDDNFRRQLYVSTVMLRNIR